MLDQFIGEPKTITFLVHFTMLAPIQLSLNMSIKSIANALMPL